jgi:hypothetical protein
MFLVGNITHPLHKGRIVDFAVGILLKEAHEPVECLLVQVASDLAQGNLQCGWLDPAIIDGVCLLEEFEELPLVVRVHLRIDLLEYLVAVVDGLELFAAEVGHEHTHIHFVVSVLKQLCEGSQLALTQARVEFADGLGELAEVKGVVPGVQVHPVQDIV